MQSVPSFADVVRALGPRFAPNSFSPTSPPARRKRVRNSCTSSDGRLPRNRHGHRSPATKPSRAAVEAIPPRAYETTSPSRLSTKS